VGARSTTEIHMLEKENALTQITQVLASHSRIDSLQIVSHGRSGELLLGQTWLDAIALQPHASQWKTALTEDADILLLGCEVAKGEKGIEFVQAIAQFTAADVAASSDRTGNFSGDWDLEIQTGNIQTTFAFQTEVYQGVLDATYHNLAISDFSQDWSNPGLITVDDNWNLVPSIVGYRGDNLTTVIGSNPQTLLLDGSATPVKVLANRTNPSSLTVGGIAEFSGTVALQASGTADAPQLVFHLNTTGRQDVRFTFTARDIDNSANDAITPIAVQYRIGTIGNFTNLPDGAIADITRAGDQSAASQAQLSILLPTIVHNQAQVQLRVLTTNAAGNDEWVAIDDIQITSTAIAINTAPTTTSDTYRVVVNSTYQTTANGSPPGVLANDSDAEGTKLTATLVTGTQNGLLTFNSDGSFTYTPNPGFEGVDTFTYLASDAIATSTPTTVTLTVSNNTTPTVNPTSGILWRNYLTGAVSLWALENTTLKTYNSLPTVSDLDWIIEATEDFDGDGDTDLLWRNYHTGQVSTWTMNGTALSFYTMLPWVPDLAWKIEATADFNQDGKRDILWHHNRTGQVAIWTLNGSTLQAGYIVGTRSDLNWSIEQAGDLTGDRNPDILWRNQRTGATDIWQLNGTQFEQQRTLYGAVSLGWRIVGLQDCDRDGDLDLVWENFNSQEICFWQLNTGRFQTSILLPKLASPYWTTVGIYDFDADGKLDLLFRNLFTGEVMVWKFNGFTPGTQNSVYTVSDLDWTIEGTTRSS
jgi:Domain of unknown function (DUF4347)/Bacterial Ig domain/FG-GAP-like repeat